MFLHHMLHGYDDGHRLLASSLPRNLSISADGQRALLILSDISGPSAGEEFEGYFTGYRVDEQWYAFARTWRAPEMSRPGCVWTHTLLLPRDVLRIVCDPHDLISFFRRPKRDSDDRAWYKHPLNVDTARLNWISSISPVPAPSFFDAVQVVSAFYRDNVEALRLITTSPMTCEPLVFALWMQQWDRQAFSFCTLSLDLRTLGQEPLTVQIVPAWRASRLAGSPSSTAVVDLDNPQLTNPTIRLVEMEAWVGHLANDLAHPVSRETIGQGGPLTNLRTFLLEFGPDVGSERRYIRALTEIFSSVSHLPQSAVVDNGEAIGALMIRVSEAFPQPSQGRALKEALFGPNRTFQVNEAPLLRVLVTASGNSSLDPDALGVEDRAARLWRSDRARAVELTLLAVSSERNVVARRFLAGVARSLDPEGLAVVTSGRPELIPFFCRQNRELLRDVGLWSRDRETARALWEVVRSEPPSEVGLGFLDAVLRSGVDGLEDEILNHFGAPAVSRVLEWFAMGSPQRYPALSDGWTRALRRHSRAALEWLASTSSRTAATLSLISAIVDPADPAALDTLEPTHWLQLAKQASSEAVEFIALVLAIGLRAGGSEGGALIAETFEAVHDAAARNSLPYAGWALVERFVPRIYEEWDQCERLRRGLGDGTIQGRWPTTTLFRAARARRTFEALIEYCRYEADGGRRFIRGLVKEDLSRLDATPEQAAVIRRYA